MDVEWKIKPNVIKERSEISGRFPDAFTQVLANRGLVSLSDVEAFLEPNYSGHVHDPYLFDDMQACVERIIQAVFEHEKVTIYGDYDLDGISATVILHDLLRLLGVSVDVTINHRERDGYGLKKEALTTLAQNGTKLLITTDSGVSNTQEVAFARELGMDVIITDHHTVPAREEDLPPANAILHPLIRASRYPYKELSGGGVAFKLAQGIIRADFNERFKTYRSALRGSSGELIHWEAYEKWLLDLVSMSTVGDCMPLTGENRVFVKFGLLVIAKTRRIGLRALLDGLRGRIKKYTPETIGFLIGPRINAASRMDHGRLAFDLLTADNERKATVLAQMLEEKNVQRQRVTERVFTEAKEKVALRLEQKKKILIGAGEDWPLGILGLVAGKLCNLYQLPVVLMTSGNGQTSGAARSIDSFHITAAFDRVQHYFERYGGHKAAGGFALKDPSQIAAFTVSLEEIANQELRDSDEKKSLEIDAVVSLRDITIDFWELIKKCEPYGKGNPRPLFSIRSARVTDAVCVGAGKKHLRLALQQDGIIRKAIGFNLGSVKERLEPGALVDIVFELDENEWNGMRELQLKILDIKIR